MKNETPFEGLLVLDEPELVANRFTGEEVLLQPDAVAVYDLITGAEVLSEYKLMQAGLDWFMKFYPSEYMVLLD
jgi:hypothetical protein